MSNIYDLDLKRLDIKYNYEIGLYGSKEWIISSNEKGVLDVKIFNIVPEDKFQQSNKLMLDIRYLLLNEINFVSHRTVRDYCTYLKYFMEFCFKYHGNIKCFSDIDYDLLIMYSNYLRQQKNAERKFQTLCKVLKLSNKYSLIQKNETTKRLKFPKVSFSNNSKKIEHYSKDDFKKITKTIINIIDEYFDGQTSESLFVKSSYGLIAICTGFNKTALNGLLIDSIELLEESDATKVYLAVGEKNRGADGYQHSKIVIKNHENHIFEKVLSELIRLN